MICTCGAFLVSAIQFMERGIPQADINKKKYSAPREFMMRIYEHQFMKP